MAEDAEKAEAQAVKPVGRDGQWLADRSSVIATGLVIVAPVLGIAALVVQNDLSAVLVVAAMLAIVFAYVVFLIAAFATPSNDKHRFRHVAYQSAAFIVLALSLRAFALDDVVHAIVRTAFGAAKGRVAMDAAMDAKTVGELAAVMILFILVEVSAFVAQDVENARTAVTNARQQVYETATDMKRTAEQLGSTVDKIMKLGLATTMAELERSVMAEAIAVTQLWSMRAPNLRGRTPTLSQECWRVLLQTYLQEERDDFLPKGRLEGIPPSVRPVARHDEDVVVSYFATNVGLYVKFLAALVRELQQRKTADQKVCIAVVTNVLPAHWWNWTFSPTEWRAYTAMERLRIAMQEIVQGGAQVDRVIAVAPDRTASQGPNELGLWPEDLLYEMLADWQILADRREGNRKETLDCSDDFVTSRQQIGEFAFARFPEALQKGSRSKSSGGQIYPMTTVPTQRTYQTNNHRWTEIPLREEYQALQGSGRYWPLKVDHQVERKLDEHFDVMFIGLGPETTGKGREGLWSTDKVDWGVCLMNSYDASVETMFLSVISDLHARREYDWWRDRLSEAVDWEAGVLPAAAIRWAENRPTVVLAPSDPKKLEVSVRPIATKQQEGPTP